MSTSGTFTNPCPAPPMTHAAVVALRDAGLLREDCVYVVSDWVQGATLPGPNLVELHAVSPNQLSMEAKVTTPNDTVAWAGLYDVDQGAVGTMQELRDNLGNVVRDAGDGASLGAFPWGAATFTNNRITDSTLTGWAAMTGVVNNNVIDRGTVDLSGNWTEFSGNQLHKAAAAATGPTVTLAGGSGARSFTGNTVRDGSSYVDVAGGTGTRAITDCEFLDGFVTNIGAGTTGNIAFDGTRFYGSAAATSLSNIGSGNRTITRSVIQSANNGGFPGLGFNSSGAVTITASTFNGGRVLQRGARGAAALSVTAGSIVNCVLNQAAGATTGALSISGSYLYAPNAFVNHNGPGAISIVNSQVGANISNGFTATRGLTITACTVGFGGVAQNRTGGTGMDTISNSRIDGGAVPLVLAGAVDPAGNQIIIDRCQFSSGHTTTITDPAGAGPIFQRSEIGSGVTLTGTGTTGVTACRFAAGCTVALGAFSHSNTVIEGLFNRTLTAANVNRLLNKAFDDVVGV